MELVPVATLRVDLTEGVKAYAEQQINTNQYLMKINITVKEKHYILLCVTGLTTQVYCINYKDYDFFAAMQL